MTRLTCEMPEAKIRAGHLEVSGSAATENLEQEHLFLPDHTPLAVMVIIENATI